jgi:hypothetical protein
VNAAYYPEPPEAQTIKSMLHIARILAIIFGILLFLGGIVYIAFLAYAATACATYAGYCGAAFGGFIATAIYLLIAGIFLVLVYTQMKSIEAKVNARQYEAAKSQTLIWMILGFIFGIILGIILLVAYIKFDPLIAATRQGGQMPPAGYGMPPQQQAWAAPPPAPMAPPPVPAAAPLCPKCGKPATYVAQYNRYYCYTDSQYV